MAGVLPYPQCPYIETVVSLYLHYSVCIGTLCCLYRDKLHGIMSHYAGVIL